MKARVKETGEFIEVVPSIYDKDSYDGNDGYTYTKESLIILNDEPDYWEKLRHQYAGMAMQGMLGNSDYIERFTAHTIDGISDEDDIAKYAKDYATALVNRFKEEEK
jgi:hypothetical protein